MHYCAKKAPADRKGENRGTGKIPFYKDLFLTLSGSAFHDAQTGTACADIVPCADYEKI
jgi:hypothetical protein